MPQYTATEIRIINLLSDGNRHWRKELLDTMEDETATYKMLSDHLSHIRKKLRPLGETIVCEYSGRKIFYRHVRLISTTAE